MIRRRRATALYAVVAAVITSLVASAVDLAVPLGLGLALFAAAATAKVAPPRRAWIADDRIVVEGWKRRRLVPISQIDGLAISFVHVDPPLLEIVFARNKMIGPIVLDEETHLFLVELVAAVEASGRANDRYIRDNLGWLRRSLER